MRPKFFYFDLGNVLLYFDHDIAFRRMAALAGTTPRRMRELLMDGERLQYAYETGTISGEQFIQSIAQSVGRSLDTNLMLEAAADMFIANPHILPVMERVKEMGIPIGLLSNTCQAHWEWICRNQYPQVTDWFSTVILSFEKKSMKPDANIYLAAEEKAGVSREDIFFTDDRPENIAAARARGWQAEPFVNADRLMAIIDRW